ncbi:HTH-type transcriptional regulator DmlR [Cupriavidus necator]
MRLGSPASYDNVVAREIGRFRRRVVASPAYLQSNASPDDPVDLVNHRCLRFSYGARDQVWTFRHGDSETKVPVSGHFRSNNAEILREVALAGGGIGLLPDWLVDDDIAAGQLTALFDDCSVNPNQASSAISALYLPNQRGSRRIGAFLEFLAALPGPTRRRD